jgi:hypothetical protein
MRLLAHRTSAADKAQPYEQELRHVDGPGQRMAEKPHHRGREHEKRDGREQRDADGEFKLAEALEHS